MIEAPTPQSATATDTPSAPSGGTPDRDLATQINQAHSTYNNALLTAYRDSVPSRSEALATYHNDLSKIQQEIGQRIAEAHREAHRAILDARAQTDPREAQRAILNAHQDLQITLFEAQLDAQRRLNEIQNSYNQALQGIEQNIRASSEVAFRDFLEAAKRVWANVQVEAINPRALHTVAQSTAESALWAGWTRGVC